MKSLKLFGSSLLFICLIQLGTSNETPNRKPVKLVDVVYDVQTMIFEQLELEDLYSLGRASQQLSIAVRGVFAVQYSMKTIDISTANWISDNRFLYDRDTITIYNYDLAVGVLNVFGPSIRKLKLFYGSGCEVHDEIIRLVTLHCADSLVEANFVCFEERHILGLMTNPFTKVETLSFGGSLYDLGSNTLTMSELFPMIRRLNLGYHKLTNKNSTDTHFPHLEHLYLQMMGPLGEGLKTEDAEKIFKKNTHIRSLVLQTAQRPVLRMASEILTNLETLEIQIYEDTDQNTDEIVFENVNTFKMYCIQRTLPRNIVFRHLTEFHVYVTSGNVPKLIRFVESNPSLKRLRMSNAHLYDEDLEQLANADLNVEEMSIDVHISFEHNAIVNILRNSGHMQEIKFKWGLNHGADIRVLRYELNHTWIITTTENDILFTRRHRLDM